MFEAKVNGSDSVHIDLENGQYLVNGKAVNPDIQKVDARTFHVLYPRDSFTVHVLEVNKEEKTVLLKVNGKSAEVKLTSEMDRLLKQLGLENALSAKVSEVKAPMPGLIHSLIVAEGEEVKQGDPLLILEAMKMENVIKSPTDGIVEKIHVKKGDNVEKNHVMVSFK